MVNFFLNKLIFMKKISLKLVVLFGALIVGLLSVQVLTEDTAAIPWPPVGATWDVECTESVGPGGTTKTRKCKAPGSYDYCPHCEFQLF